MTSSLDPLLVLVLLLNLFLLGTSRLRAVIGGSALQGVVLGVLAFAVLFMGVYPLPFTEVMHASVGELLRHVAQPKF